jgi:hypothetical protein
MLCLTGEGVTGNQVGIVHEGGFWDGWRLGMVERLGMPMRINLRQRKKRLISFPPFFLRVLRCRCV